MNDKRKRRNPCILDSRLRGNDNSIIKLNKPFLLCLIGLAIFLVILIFNQVWQVAPKPKRHLKQIKPALNAIANTKPTINKMLQDLPNSYLEINKIKKYQPTLTQKTTKIPAYVEQELNYLKQQQVELQQRLALLTVQSVKQHIAKPVREDLPEARKSKLFFADLTPTNATNKQTNPINTSSTTNSNQTDTNNNHHEKLASQKQNSQQQKIQFLTAKHDANNIYNLHNMTKPISPYEVQAGTLIPAVLLTGVNTSLPGSVVARIRQDIYDSVTGKYLLIPKGAKLLGAYNAKITLGQRRVLIAFTRIIRPDGSSILLSKTNASDLQGQAGMQAKVNNHWLRIFGAATLSTILSVGAGVAADQQNDNNTYYPSAKQSAILGAANSISAVGQNITSRALNIQPTLTIPAGFEFNVIVQKDMILTPI